MKKLVLAALCATALIPLAAGAQTGPVATANQSGTGNTIIERQIDARAKITVTQAGSGNSVNAVQSGHVDSVMDIVQADTVKNTRVSASQGSENGEQHGSRAIIRQANADGGFASIHSYGSNNLAQIVQAASTWAAVSQFGSGNAVVVKQQAPGDTRDQVGSTSAHPVLASQNGDGNVIALNQVGANNMSHLRQGDYYGVHANGSSIGLDQRGAGNDTYVFQRGDENAIRIAQNGFESSAWAEQFGQGTLLDVFQAADHSLIDAKQTGTGASATLKQTGGTNNVIMLTQDLPNGRATATQSGANNALTIIQTGYVAPIPALTR